jgi:adenosylmethionine-8-amino-7-oxononanoate aminotransferase
LIYPSSGCANGTDGDVVMMGPPFVIKRSELHMAAEVTALAIEAATSSALATSVSE